MIIVCMIREKIAKTVLHCIVYYDSAQCYAYIWAFRTVNWWFRFRFAVYLHMLIGMLGIFVYCLFVYVCVCLSVRIVETATARSRLSQDWCTLARRPQHQNHNGQGVWSHSMPPPPTVKLVSHRPGIHLQWRPSACGDIMWGYAPVPIIGAIVVIFAILFFHYLFFLLC